MEALMTFEEMLASAQRSAVHLEMRDAYVPDDPSFIAWQGGPPYDRTERERDWHQLIGSTRERDVTVRRARIVSEPVTDYIRFEHSVTDSMNIKAGEQVRWLPRRQASDLLLPGNDLWVFDDHLIRFGFFAGDGRYLGDELVRNPDTIKRCLTAFEAVWERATDHAEYRLV
ncbi:DUF6879 family protein [Nonomuraea sp. NEAU-A123]|uniref:DUF6879 family protein n=1 Tax=Nonomuraea sp. NEAU-A123 TaxID=2839649 RepID=UPI0027E02128|nr:DUF6879 family protein [Nonomuraea sp. NEAU-A123]